MTANSESATIAIQHLSGAFSRLHAIASLLNDPDRQPGDNEWATQDVLVHLVASNEILISRVKQILVRGDAPLPGFDERSRALVCGYAELPASELVSRIENALLERIRLLALLPTGALERTGVHETHGRVSVGQIVDGIVTHTDEHIEKIEAILR